MCIRDRYRSPIYKDISYHVKYDLDFDKMVKESKYLIGTHDFKGFMSSGSSVKDTVREISVSYTHLDVYKRQD